MLLCVLSGTLLGLSFPPGRLGILACVGLIPLLIVLSSIDGIRGSKRYIYVTMLVFHIITLNWTGGYAHGNDGYMMIAGFVTMVFHPFFYLVPMLSYMFLKKHVGERGALISLPFMWVGYEYSHSLSEWSFPWLTIGNSQSYNLSHIQFISATGVFGLSLWILLLNVLGYFLLASLLRKEFKLQSRTSILFAMVWLLFYFLPAIHGSMVLSDVTLMGEQPSSENKRAITVGIVQSNVDPWEKWKQTGMETINLYLSLTREMIENSEKPDIVLWPETAVPYYLLTPANRPTLEYLRNRLTELDVPVLAGLPQAIYYSDSTEAPPSAKRVQQTGERYDAFNAAAFIQPGVEELPWYGKMKMVPIAERVPYADAFYFFDFLRWGVGIGGWQVGMDSVIFIEKKTGARFCSMICYESTYPEFVASFVKRGAEFITIITIDSWWDRMSGAFQHHQFAIFRAVENRRWIARCAVGGLSSYIDPYGRVYDRTDLFTKTTLSRTIERRSELTFYTEHGEWLAQTSVVVWGMFLAAGVGQLYKNKRRMLS
ncbi:MAG: apolipoprotein N-acyltransferase [Ignavibacteriae bacterium]|nr:apolipoprotein N-acyltransferase [Ignavibacteriota bacterium]